MMKILTIMLIRFTMTKYGIQLYTIINAVQMYVALMPNGLTYEPRKPILVHEATLLHIPWMNEDRYVMFLTGLQKKP
jgi:hypothetical protein